ncbi:carbohydrate ABC transporter permease [Paenibacillus alkalitolerans]|uniref:carbohydrate ABC transporter permease n=1 Tax=Paenibacillus alkalitolerans TaxID=2799335 RepID=UPI0018F39ADE|nr:carbohydrate ABC transporter permease [Paenibacillus alkalitolerans]
MRRTALNVLLLLVSVISILPFYFLIVMTTRVTGDIFKGKIFLPGAYFADNFRTVLGSSFFHSYWNSILVSVTATAVCVFISAMTGYALTKYEFKLRGAFFAFIIGTMMIPPQIGMIGYLIEMRFLHLTDSLVPLILVWTTNAFGVFWMAQYIKSSLHTELIESARVDGCNEFRIFLQIVLPVIKPAVATLSMVIFLWSWNNYMLPLVLVNKESLFTIPLSIKSLGNIYYTDYGARLTGLLFAILPLILIFVLGSKSFIRGLTAGAVKG